MVTRDIKKNTATQVNANLIGVQVRPDTWKVVDSIDVDITNNWIEVYPCVMYDGDAGKYVPAKSGNMPAFLANVRGGGYEIYFISENSETDVNGDKYNECLRYPDGGEPVYMKADDTIASFTRLYDLNWDESQQGYVAVAKTEGATSINVPFTIEGIFVQISIYEYIDVYGNIIMKEGVIEGAVTSTNDGSEGFIFNEFSDTGTYSFDKTNISSVREGVTYYYWDGKQVGFPTYNLYDSGVGTLITWDDIKVGDRVIFNMIQPSYNPLSVKSVSEHQESDVIKCDVEYSVDGTTWTEWPENLTDDNNVISNIPRYMYLKFSQDVVITEE